MPARYERYTSSHRALFKYLIAKSAPIDASLSRPRSPPRIEPTSEILDGIGMPWFNISLCISIDKRMICRGL